MHSETWVQFTTVAILVTFLLARLSVARPSGGYLNLDVSSTPDFQDSLNLKCTLRPGMSGIVSIHLGKKVADGKGRHQDKVLASVGFRKNSDSEGSDMSMLIDTFFDSTGTRESRVSVILRQVACKDEGTYYCDAANRAGTVFREETQISLCNNISELVQIPVEEANPTHSLVTCRLATNKKVRSIFSMELLWQGRTLAYANTSAKGGHATPVSPLPKTGLKVLGKIVQHSPDQSQLVVEFPSQTCEDAPTGTFACNVRYWASTGASIPRLAHSSLETSQPCDKNYPGISIRQPKPLDLTMFDVVCGQEKYSPGILISLEISFVSDTSPMVRRQIAYFDRFSSGTKLRVNTGLEEKRVTSSTSDNSVKLSFYHGSCGDAGVYRCQAVYQPKGETEFKVKISEMRLSGCLAGAMASVEVLEAKHDRRVEKFVCRVDPMTAGQLISLEVSVIKKGVRQVLAYMNRFVNNGKISYATSDVVAEGKIVQYDLSASSLNVTSSSLQLKETSLYVTTCKAVLSSKNKMSPLLESMADAKFRLRN